MFNLKALLMAGTVFMSTVFMPAQVNATVIETPEIETEQLILTIPIDEDLKLFNIGEAYCAYIRDYSDVDYSWDVHGRMETIEVLWPYLTEICGFTPEQAAGILGNICCEGRFGQFYGTSYIEDVPTIMAHLDAEYSSATGIAQWLSYSRRQKLLNHYEKWYNVFTQLDCQHYTSIAAECEFLYEEIQDYQIFKDGIDYSIEDACGRVAVLYEAYDSSSSDWVLEGNTARLVKGFNGSSGQRLNYALGIYEMMQERK